MVGRPSGAGPGGLHGTVAVAAVAAVAVPTYMYRTCNE